MATRSRRVSLKPVGEAIRKVETELKALRKRVPPEERTSIDLYLKQLRKRHTEIQTDCRQWWCVPTRKGK